VTVRLDGRFFSVEVIDAAGWARRRFSFSVNCVTVGSTLDYPGAAG